MLGSRFAAWKVTAVIAASLQPVEVPHQLFNVGHVRDVAAYAQASNDDVIWCSWLAIHVLFYGDAFTGIFHVAQGWLYDATIWLRLIFTGASNPPGIIFQSVVNNLPNFICFGICVLESPAKPIAQE